MSLFDINSMNPSRFRLYFLLIPQFVSWCTMMSSKVSTRRDFIYRLSHTAAAGLVFPAIVPAGVFATPGPNEKIAIGMIGVGRRGRQNMDLPPDAQIVAIADVNRIRMDEVAAGKDWRKYQDYKQMLAADDIDAVIVSSPDHWHTLHSIHACQAGKDVYCEKPMTLTVREGRALVNAVRKHERVFQTGSQQRSMKECRIGCELVRNGYLGTIHTVHGSNYPSPWECDLPEQPVPEGLDWDMWLGQTEPRPYHIDLYLPRANPGWISFRPYSGGEMTGWGSHGLDIMQWALGTDQSGPLEVWPEGEGLTCPVSFKYANGVTVKLDNEGPAGGGLFVGEAGEIVIDRGKFETKPTELAGTILKDTDVHLEVSENHYQNWLDCIRSRNRPIADVEIGHRSATMCHLGNIARWTGRKLQWDPEKELFVGDDDANTFLERPMRAPYQLPEI